MSQELREFVTALPKAELHLHIEGTLEPEMMFEIARRNGVEVPYASVEEARAACSFADLQGFLDVYYAASQVLLTEQDFFDLTWAYLKRAHADGVVHAEIFFDPQTHTARGVPFEAVIGGIVAALARGERELSVTTRLIMCFLRHLPEADAIETWHRAQPYLPHLAGVGLDSGERGNPPEKFARVFALAREAGLRVTAHAGEEGPAASVWSALDVLRAERIDHGDAAVDDPVLVQRLAIERIPLTMCPLSNQRLQVIPDLARHPLKALLDAGVMVTVNSDDPAYFGGYVVDNYIAIAEALGLSRDELRTLADNSLAASWR